MRVSLIITTYNRPEALSLVLKSVVSQSKFPYEVIIADDGSEQQTKKCIDFFKESSDLNLIHSWQEDKGFRVSMSRNKAITKSSGDYIVLIDGDMVLHDKFLEDHSKNAELGFFVQGPRVLLNQDKTNKAVLRKKIKFSFFSNGLSNRLNAIHSNFLANLFIKKKKSIVGIKACNLAFYRKDCIKVNGFNNDIIGWGREDSEFIVRLINSGINRKNIHFNLIQYHLWHPSSTRKYLKKNQLILEKSIQKKLIYCNNGINQFL